MYNKREEIQTFISDVFPKEVEEISFEIAGVEGRTDFEHFHPCFNQIIPIVTGKIKFNRFNLPMESLKVIFNGSYQCKTVFIGSSLLEAENLELDKDLNFRIEEVFVVCSGGEGLDNWRYCPEKLGSIVKAFSE